MNVPFKKHQVKDFINSEERFMSSGSHPSRSKRREKFKKDRKKSRIVIYTDPTTGMQGRNDEYYQLIKMKDGSSKRIQHFKQY